MADMLRLGATAALIAEWRDRLKGVTPGPWQVVIDSHPWKLSKSNKEGNHTERRIFTAYNDPQLKSPWPVVNLSCGITDVPGKAVEFIHIEDADATHIASCSPEGIETLLTALESLQTERDGLAARIVKLEAALEPFAQRYEVCKKYNWEYPDISLEQCHDAARVLKEKADG